jgi:hypothetical protein
MADVPEHYKGSDGRMCADFIRDAIGQVGMHDFWRGNAMKYLFRAGKKIRPDGYQDDIRKAIDCLQRLLAEGSDNGASK